jgi:hypothetical protein
MISYAKTAIEGHTSEYDKQEHLTENNGDDNDDESSEVDDNDRDGDYKQRDSSDDVVCRQVMYHTKVLMYRTMVLMARPTKVRC